MLDQRNSAHPNIVMREAALERNAIKVRRYGRPVNVTFTGNSNRVGLVKGNEFGGEQLNTRIVETNWGKGDADFHTPAMQLARICSDLVHERGIEKLEALRDMVKETETTATLVAKSGKIHGDLPAVIRSYIAEWNKVMGDVESPVIFREDVADIARTLIDEHERQSQQDRRESHGK